MTTSREGFRVRVGTQFPGEHAISSTLARRIIQNNLCHYADIYGQVRAAWAAKSGEYLESAKPTVANTPMWTWSTGQFPLALRANRASYRMRVRIAGASSGGHACKFYAVLCPIGRSAEVVLEATDAVFVTTTTTSATPAWLTGASQGSNAYTTMVGLTASEADQAAEIVPVPSVAGSTTILGVAQCLVELVVFGHSANSGSTPRLAGVYASEWVGD